MNSNTSLLEDWVDTSVSQCTVIELSCDFGRMTCLTVEQKRIVKSLYRVGRKVVSLESHLEFLEESLKNSCIPTSFRLNNSLPGNGKVNQSKNEKVCIEAMNDEQDSHGQNL